MTVAIRPVRRPPREARVDQAAVAIHRVLVDRGIECVGRHTIGTGTCQAAADAMHAIASELPTYPALRLSRAINAFALEVRRQPGAPTFQTTPQEVERLLLPLLEDERNDDA